MCTRTLSTTISTSRPMGRLSHRPGYRGRTGAAHQPDDQADDEPEDETTDVGEECNPAAQRLATERGDAIDELQDEPEAEDDEGRDLQQLVEEAEEDQRQDPCSGEQRDVRSERCGD